MTDSDDAYAAALRQIEQARVAGAKALDFNEPETCALTQLPPEIGGLDKLKSLNLMHTQVNDLSSLTRLTGITRLLLNHTKVSDLSPLAGLTGITQLWLNHTPVSDLSPLAGLTGITQLLLNNTQVSDLSPLARLMGITQLSLNNTQVSDLSPLARLTGISQLRLSNTPVSDIFPLARLTGITQLWLNNTQVSDLSPLSAWERLEFLNISDTPIRDLHGLPIRAPLRGFWCDTCPVLDLRPLRAHPGLLGPFDDRTPLIGIHFKDTRATQADPRLAEIDEIEDDAERAKVLFEYLEGWELPGGTWSEIPPDPDPLLQVHAEDEKLEISASLPSEAERDERLKRVLHDRLQAKAAELAQAAGNRFPRLAARARAVVLQADRPFEEVDLLLLHLEVADLSERAEAGSEEGDAFPPDVTGPLTDVLRIGPGLTLGNADVELLNDRIKRAKAAPPPTDEKAAHDQMSRAVAADDQAMGDRLRALEQRVESLPADVAIAVQQPAHRNILWKIGTLSLLGAGVVATGIMEYIAGETLG